MPILNYTTKVNVYRTISEIEATLAEHGATMILKQYGNDKKIAALSFTLETPVGQQPIRLPANVDAVKKVLERQKVKADNDQAERVAWRILKDWVEAQMAILEAEMVTMDEIFMPYMLIDGQRTLYEAYRTERLRIGD